MLFDLMISAKMGYGTGAADAQSYWLQQVAVNDCLPPYQIERPPIGHQQGGT